MSLNRRQTRAFTDIGDLYAPSTQSVDPTTKRSLGQRYNLSAPSYSDVACRLEPAREPSQAGVQGRSGRDVRVTMDTIRFNIDQEFDDVWYFQLKTPGHPEYGTWFLVLGGLTEMIWKANTRVAYVKRSTEPPDVA